MLHLVVLLKLVSLVICNSRCIRDKFRHLIVQSLVERHPNQHLGVLSTVSLGLLQLQRVIALLFMHDLLL